MKFRNLTLEISLKPFCDHSEAGIRAVAEKLFEQWRPLIKECETASLMFWTADGSELLDYRGRMDDTFEWCQYIGVANAMEKPHDIDLPEEQWPTHYQPVAYCANPPVFTYRDLKRVLDTMRQVYHEKFGGRLHLVTTFDPGPEFAKSDFKYNRHPELCLANTLGKKSFVCCYAELKSDTCEYAGFPNGIPEGTSLGTFLGRQAKHFCADLGFDSMWLSNGFGFGLETWRINGAVFDGKTFSNKRCPEVKEKIFNFWNDLRRECPDLPLKTRGTNFTTGKDLSSDGVPLRNIYRDLKDIQPPPNSPWAALNDDFGLELVGWMSHIAELPTGGSFPFRFYTHDPWFHNSPWLDRYGRSPHDIYLPMALCRLDDQGKTSLPDVLNLLTVDDSYGRMPDQVPQEVIPYILDCRRKAPDAAGPFVWLYPFDEYHDLTFAGTNIEEVFFGDWFMRTAVNTGFPLNTVVSTRNYLSALNNGADFSGNIIVTPTTTAVNVEVRDRLLEFIRKGGQVLFYGPLRDAELRKLFQVRETAPLAGEFAFAGLDGQSGKVIHETDFSGGPLDLSMQPQADAVTVLAAYRQGSDERPAALYRGDRAWQGGGALWVRGTNSFIPQGWGMEMRNRDEFFYPETLMRQTLRQFGYRLEIDKELAAQPEPILVFRRHQNALFMAEFAADTAQSLRLRMPDGMPVFVGSSIAIRDGLAHYAAQKAVNLECRIFVDQESGVVKCREWTSEKPGFVRKIEVTGLKNATVRFRPVPGKKPHIILNPTFYDIIGETAQQRTIGRPDGEVIEISNANGKLVIRW